MFKKNKFTILILIFGLITLEKVLVVYSQETDAHSGIGVIPDGQTWYICSKGTTNYISYMLKVVQTPEEATPGFGTNVQGNRPLQYGVPGLLTFVANYTNIRNLVDPNGPPVSYRQELSCSTTPVQDCNKSTNPALPIQDILCLGIVNSNQNETKFTANISFDQGTNLPILTIPPGFDDNGTNSSNKSPTKTTPGIDPSETHSFFVNIAIRSGFVDFGYLLVLSLLFSIFGFLYQ